LGKRAHIVVASVLLIGLGIGLSINVSAEEGLIPSWIKTTAGFWVDNQISDSEFISALQFLVKERILVIPQSNIVSESTSKVTTAPSIITGKYQFNLESFFVKDVGDNIWGLFSITDNTGKFVSKSGELRIILLDFNDNEIYNQKKYLVADNFSEVTNKVTGETVKGFKFIIYNGQIKKHLSEQSFTEESLYNNGLGTIKISLGGFENEILLSHLPINEGFFNEDTGFVDNFQVNKILDVGPFFITVKDVGRYMVEDDRAGKGFRELFKVNLNTKFKYVEGVTFILDEIYLTDKNNVLYSSDERSIDNYKNVFLGESYEYEGGNGYILFEEIPSDISEIKLVLKITRVEGDVSDTHYEDEIEISLR